MKILQINKLYYPWLGGVETHVKELAEELVKDKQIQLKVLCCNTEFKTSKEIINNIEVIKAASLGIFFSLPISFSFFEFLRTERADILHFHLPNPLAVLAYLLVKPKGKVIITWHSDIVRQKWVLFFYKPFLNLFLKKADKIIATSENMLESSPFLQEHKAKTTIIPLGLDLERYQKTDQIKKLATEIQQKQNRFILFVGRLVYYKGVDVLLKALKGTDVKLIVIGEGELEKKLKNYAKENLIVDQICFLGPQPFENLLAYYYACDFLVLPSVSRSEAFGIVQLEAMTCARPVVSTRLGTGVEYVNQDGVTGFTVAPKNANELQKAILKLWDDAELGQKMGQAAYDRVKKEFGKEKMITRIKKVYG
jgi:glycosyltransferase involved in cell wall biosynthesis